MIDATNTTILVVDDFGDARALNRFLLEQTGFRVVEACSGHDALAMAATAHPDLIVLDVHLPDIDGFEVCRRLKADAATAPIPILHLSAAYRTTEHRVRGLEGGADGYLALPIEPQEFLATVKALLRVRRAEAALRQSQERALRLAAIVESSDDAIVSVTADDLVSTWNPGAERLFGYAADEMIGRSLGVLAPADRTDELPEFIERLRRGERLPAFETVRVGKHGHAIDVAITMSPIRDFEDTIAGVAVIAKDITDRKRMEKLEREADTLRVVASVAAAAGHQINNPLAVVVGSLELVLREGRLGPQERLRVQRALAASARIEEIVKLLPQIRRLEFAAQEEALPRMLDLRKSASAGDVDKAS